MSVTALKFWALIILVGMIAGGVWHYKHLISENARLKTELTTANSTVSALDETIRRNNEIYEHERDVIDEIENAPNSDDGPISPVLRRAIERLQ